MDPKGSNLASTDLLEISELVSGSYVTKSITGAEIIGGASAGFVPYIGAIQDLDLGENELYTGKLWLYDAVNDNYGSTHYTDGNYHIEDADGHKLLVIEDGFVQIHKTDTIQSNLYTSGLTAIRDHYLPDASGTIALTSDIPSLAGYVPTTRTLTINGTTQDLSADRTFTVSTGITIGTTAITSGTVGRVLFEGTGNVVQESANFTYTVASGLNLIGGAATSATSAVLIQNSALAEILRVRNDSVIITKTTEFNVQANGLTVPTNGNQLMFNLVGSGTGMSITNQNGTTYRIGQYAASNVLTIGHSSNSTLNLFSSGNIGINTTTDAGFKLDVNGTARVQGNLQLEGSTAITFGSSIGRFTIDGSFIRFKTVNGGDMLNMTANFLGIFETSVVPSAVVSIASTTRGFLPPRMTTTQKNAIATPATGLMVYDTTLNLISVYNGTSWITL